MAAVRSCAYRSGMPSQLHEILITLFRNRPTLAPELLNAGLLVDLPDFHVARIESANLTEVQPAEYRADLVVTLATDAPRLAIIIEVQLQTDPRKRFVWPAYVAGLRARLECPVCLLVVATSETVGAWASEPICLGGPNVFTPLVLPLSKVPEVFDAAAARDCPELAVLSAMAHGYDAPPHKAVRIAMAAFEACVDLDAERSRMYFDLIHASLGEAARRELLAMDPAKYEYQSELAKRLVAEGRAEGKAEGRAEGKADLLAKLLSLRFGALGEAERARLADASLDELDRIGERLMDAKTLDEALGKH